MTQSSKMPTAAAVSAELAELVTESTERGVLPSVLALARRLGIANTTLRRNFPEAVEALTKHRQTDRSTPTPTEPTSHIQHLELENRKLRTRNRELTEQIALASSQIQQLSIEGHHLRTELHHRNSVTTISTPRK